MSEYNYISKEFKKGNHLWKATDEICRCGKGYVVLRRTGYVSDLSNLEPNTLLKTKICVPRTSIRDMLN